MNGQTKTLLIIGLFITAMVASFIWFVATWDKDKEQPVSAVHIEEALA